MNWLHLQRQIGAAKIMLDSGVMSLVDFEKEKWVIKMQMAKN